MNKVPTKALHHITIDGCRFETVLRYNPSTDYIGITTTRRGNYTNGRAKRAEYAKTRRRENPEANAAQLASNKKWRDDHPDYIADYLVGYRTEHKEEIKDTASAYYDKRKDHILARNSRYAHEHPRESRDYVLSPPLCIKLNQPFPGSVGHHVTSGTLIYIPEEMNKGTLHNIRTGRGMYDINSQAINYLRGSI